MPKNSIAIRALRFTTCDSRFLMYRCYIALLFALAMGAAGCGTSKPAIYRDPELKQVTEAAHAALKAGNPAGAADLYSRGLTRARIMDDAGEISRTAYNLGICLGAVGRYDEALRRLSEARHETCNIAQSGIIDLAEAKILLRQNRMDDCRRLLASALTKLGDDSSASVAIQLKHVSASLAIAAGDHGGARGALSLADHLIDKTTDVKLRAEHAELTARILKLEDRAGESAAGFEKAAALYRQCGLYTDMRLMLAVAAGAWEKAGKLDVAAEIYFRAGRSHLSAGQSAVARVLLARAADLAAQVGNTALVARALDIAPQ